MRSKVTPGGSNLRGAPILLAQAFWYNHPSKLFLAGSAGIVLIACLLAIIMLRRQRQRQEEIAPVVTTDGSVLSDELLAERLALLPKGFIPYQMDVHHP